MAVDCKIQALVPRACQCFHSGSHALLSFLLLMCSAGGTVDIGEADIDVDEGVELIDPSELSEKMVLMPVADTHQNQEDISESCHAEVCFNVLVSVKYW